MYGSKCGVRGGVVWFQPMSTQLYTGAQGNFVDLTPLLTYSFFSPDLVPTPTLQHNVSPPPPPGTGHIIQGHIVKGGGARDRKLWFSCEV